MSDDIRDMQNQNPARRTAGDGPTPPDHPSTDVSDRRAADGHVSPEVIAAWLDMPGDLDATDRESITAHIAGCVSCQEVVADLRGIVTTLTTLSLASTPRSFALTQKMLDTDASPGIAPTAQGPIRMHQTNGWHERQYRAVRWATAVAAVLFVLVLSLDLVTNRLDPDRSDGRDAAMSSQTGMTTGGGAASDDESPAEDSDELAEESSEMEVTSSDDEEAGQSQEPQDDVARAEATSASGTTAEDDSPALESPSEEASAESTDTTLAVKESDESGDASVAQQTEPEVVDATSERLRIIQVALALILVWLLAAMIALPRGRRS